MPKLTIYKGSQLQREYVFPEADILVIGRTQLSEIVLPDDSRKVSRYHAGIIRVAGTADRFFVRDFGSLHCTKVGDVPVYQRILSDGDVIQIANHRLVYSTKVETRPRCNHLRVVSRKTDAAFPETSTLAFDPGEHPSAVQLPAEKRELFEQLHHKVRRGAEISEFAEELVTAVLHILRSDRGFIGLFRTGHPELYHEVGLVNLGPEPIEISDIAFAEHLKQGKTVVDGTTLLVPIPSSGDVIGFFCINRLDRRRLFGPEDSSFLIAAGRLLPAWSRRETSETAGAAELIEWPMEMVGKSKKMEELGKEIGKGARTDMNVLILGETGTGKELVAKAIHSKSRNAKGPFIARNCGQTTETLAESEIFGYGPRSGISGANPLGAKGWFEEANGGTLFLDEIHRLTPAMQDKFLRVLQEKSVSRIGMSAAIQVDVKVLGATDEDLERAVHEGSVRGPFYYRFGMSIHLPPLRERKEDIPLLAYYFLDKYAKKYGSRTRIISHRALHQLFQYDWPGNVRELEHAVEAGVSNNREVLFSWDFRDLVGHAASRREDQPVTHLSIEGAEDSIRPKQPSATKSMDEIEKEKIKEALEVTQGNVTRAAQLLGYRSRQTILNKMDRYSIPRNYADPQAVA
jgi:DNA-binding NtrC family response regulator